MAHVRSFKDAEDLLPILKQCGCKELEIGIESGNKEENNLILQLGILVIVPKKKSINL